MRAIKPINHHGSIQLKFSHNSKRYSFNPIPGADFNATRDIAQAIAIATKISNDILAGYFDTTLERYRIATKASQESNTNNTKPRLLLDLWDKWVDTLGLSEATKANHYKTVRIMIAKHKPSIIDAQWFIDADLATRTKRDRISLLRACYNWAMVQGLVNSNPYQDLKLKKSTTTPIKPFSQLEIANIINGFQSIAPHYLPFVKFLLLTGVRVSEAIGLRWADVDFDRSELTIAFSLSKDPCGNGYTRIRKETKTGSMRVLPMSQSLRDTLSAIAPTHELVFTTLNGCTIDADNFRERTWANVLKAVGVPYRKIHNTRHTMISHAIDQGIAPTGVAYLAGHSNTRMIMTTYGHMINKPSLPKMF